MSNEQLEMSNEQWAFCFALRQNGYILDNASIVLSGCLKRSGRVVREVKKISKRYHKYIRQTAGLT